MSRTPEIHRVRRLPTKKDAVVFRVKTALLQARHAAADSLDKGLSKHGKGSHLRAERTIAVSTTPLWTESEPEERFLLAGKIHNLRLAVKELDGVEVPAGKVLSFWKQIGRASRLKGFVVGRELREGCIIPNVGGGLCQLSNALYDAALQAGFEIVERHAHTQVIPGSLAEKGRDATVFWNYVDLRFRSENVFRIEAKLDAENLTIKFRGTRGTKPESAAAKLSVAGNGLNSCATCETTECHRVIRTGRNVDFGRTAYLVDEFVPEFDRYILENRTGSDCMMIPLDGRRFSRANYAWSTGGFASVRQSVLVTAKRSYRSRKLAAQGAARQRNLLLMYEELAESFAKRLTYDVLHVVVQQNLLPFLWRGGHLGGRTFDVLMTALPMNELQRTLDRAHSLHPEGRTLSDFRADPELVAAETEALRHARRLITPHTGIASLFPNRGHLVEWMRSVVSHRKVRKNSQPVIVFPASTVGRKGCYELREALRGLDVELVLLGPVIEEPDFWNGFDTQRGSDDWLDIADAVVLPAYVEHRPRRLLAAAGAGIPVIASKACGVANVEEIETIETGDTVRLRELIVSVVAGCRAMV